MTSNDIKIGNYYYFDFLSEWSDDYTGSYKVTGFVSVDIAGEIGGETIYKTFFENYGFDTDKYDSYIDDNTVVYVVTKLVTTDPIEESTENTTIYIPSSLINFSNSYAYIQATRLIYSFTSNPRVLDTDLDLNNFKSSSKLVVKEALKNTTEFVADSLSVDVSNYDVLTTESEYEEFEENKETYSTARKTALKQDYANKEASERKLYLATNEMLEAKENYETKYDSLTSKITEANNIVTSNTAISETLTNIKAKIIEIIAYAITVNPTAFSSISSLDSTYTAEQVYAAIENIVSSE